MGAKDVKKMKILEILGKSKKAVGGIIAIILLIAIIFYAGVLMGSSSSKPEITSTGLTQTLEDIDELAVIQYNYTKIGEFSNSLDFNGWTVPLTQKSFLITYDGHLKAGVDMSGVKVSVNNKTITVTIPEVKILSNEIDEKSIEVYDESNNLFNPISITDYKKFATKQKEKVEEEAIENGLLSQAATKVQSTITNQLNMIDDIKNNYTIEVVMNNG